MRSPGNHWEKVIKTAIDVPQVLIFPNYLIADFDKKDERLEALITKENAQMVGIMLHIYSHKTLL